jgi:vancomycin permeability regulator SanA
MRPQPPRDRLPVRHRALALLRRIARATIAAGTLVALVLLALRIYTAVAYRDRIHPGEQARPAPVAVVFGAGLTPRGQPTAVLYDRVATGVALYQQGTVARLLMSGDGRAANHDEPDAMRRLAVSLGVPNDAILLDRDGLRTYATCYRTRHVFGVQQAIPVTQEFHLPRALFTCSHLGVEVSGVPADRRAYPWRHRVSWQLRELFATAAAWADVFIINPTPARLSLPRD